MLRLLGWFVGLTVVIVLSVGGVGTWGYSVFVQPGPVRTNTNIIIPKGAGIERIANLLLDQGLILNALIFRLGAIALGREKALRAGEFSIPPQASSEDILGILRSGKTVVRRLTVAEGLTTAEVLSRLARTEGLTGVVTSNPGEGRLLPETYHFSFGDSRNDIVRRMRSAMDKTVRDLWAKRKPGLPYRTTVEALVMASIVERETGLAAERARVAGVFVNRLNRSMRLQSDPTVIYGLADGLGSLGRSLTRKDLADPHPYNTYVHNGLPPGPIANPGRAAIEAALNPADTDAIYFVADGKGGHAFARTLKEHNRNVAAWRKLQRQKQQSR